MCDDAVGTDGIRRRPIQALAGRFDAPLDRRFRGGAEKRTNSIPYGLLGPGTPPVPGSSGLPRPERSVPTGNQAVCGTKTPKGIFALAEGPAKDAAVEGDEDPVFTQIIA